MTMMFIYESNAETFQPIQRLTTAVASQEEIYLEETEEELRVILESDDPLPPRSERPSQHREPAAEELITGDSDDPPLSEEAVEEMLSMTLIKDLHGYGPLSLTRAGQA
jgi:hypothetical protein